MFVIDSKDNAFVSFFDLYDGKWWETIFFIIIILKDYQQLYFFDLKL